MGSQYSQASPCHLPLHPAFSWQAKLADLDMHTKEKTTHNPQRIMELVEDVIACDMAMPFLIAPNGIKKVE